MTARLLTPLVGALLLLWLLAALTWYSARQIHDANATAAATQDRVFLLSEIRSLSRSLQRDALNLVTEQDPHELPTIISKFDTRSRKMRTELRTLERTEHNALPPDYFSLSYGVIDALQAVARQAQSGDRRGALARFHRQVRPAERAASKVADGVIEAMTERTGTLRDDASQVESDAAAIFVVAVLALTVSGLVAGIIITRRSVILPLHQLQAGMRDLAHGAASARIPDFGRSDEIGQMSQTLADLQRQLLLAERGKQEQARQIIEQIGRALAALARGDLTVRVDGDLAGEFAQLGADLNTAMMAVAAALAIVRRSADELADSADMIRSASDELAERSERQASSLANTASAMHQITQTVEETANAAGRANAMVAAARGDAEEMGEIVRRATEAMIALERSSAEISEIISVIDGFAFQTSLLALNARIEAARAGDAGLGFAVVAAEVRALAQRSTEAAHDVKVRITGSVRQVDVGVGLVTEAGGALERIKARVIDAAELVASISHAAREQSIGLQQVNDAVAQMDATTQDNVAMVQEATSAVHQLDLLVRAMTEQVERFRLADSTTAPATALVPWRRTDAG
ncbi:HAMP domain-containing methyl-accepting chemotaxis protein [Sphingomonas sp. BK235]|uniref:methyl-accepting chemotaxis protein n=1 Tax=Sphingomonas sp. BK235 TaxID=2512131 RepID=UPI00140552D1|nr:HAMP domain-containing methyl-accepting chemotaxis protein [Sphingomonas sp. BK235]